MSSFNVSSTSGLVNALKSAHAGDQIYLASGTYSGLVLNGANFSSAVTITSKDPGHQAVITDFTINSSSGLNFNHLDFATTTSADPYAFRLNTSSNITFDHLNVHGSMDNNTADDKHAFLIRDSSNVVVSNSEFQELYSAINHLDDNGLIFSNNVIHDIRMDGIRGGGSSNVQVLNNKFYDFHAEAGDHDDAVQFWSVNAKAAASNIVVSGNIITRGNGDPIQGVYLESDNTNLVNSNIKITGNTVEGGSYNGIYVLTAKNVEISNNVVTPYDDQQSWIRVDNVTGANLTNNGAGDYIITKDTALVQTGDYVTASKSAFQMLLGPAGVVTAAADTTLGVLQHTLQLTGSQNLNGFANDKGDQLLGNDGANVLTGGAGNDSEFGGAGNDTLIGGAGNDTLSGGGGDDLIFGGAGANVVDGGAGVNTLTFVNSTSGVVFDLSIHTQQSVGGLEKETVSNIQNVIGSATNDVIVGDSANNVIVGGAGNDNITGGVGADSLYGGQGTDDFIYRSLADSTVALSGRDVIFDFDQTQADRIDFRAIDTMPSGGKWAFASAFTGKAGQVTVVTSGDHYVVEADINGDKIADFAIDVHTATKFTWSGGNFIF